MLLRHSRSLFFKAVALFLSVLFPAMSTLPQLAQAWGTFAVSQKESLYFVSQPPYSVDLDRLLAACPDPTDTDGDGLPDQVERILGTDPELTDSDFDRLDDYYEVSKGLNPQSPDSNRDGLSDYIEENETPNRDFDGDGLANAWDGDNDNDGVYDPLDLSPFACSIAKQNFRFNIHTTGKPMYINIQVRPRDPDHLRLPFQYFDWENGDDKGTMQDTDNSVEDVCITPALEVSANHLPDYQDLDKYGIYVVQGKAYIPLYTTDHFGSPSAFNGRIFYPGQAWPRDITLDARLIWMVTGKTDQGVVAPGDPFSTPSLSATNDGSMGGGMAMADINGNGTPDMVFLGVDATGAEDSLAYIIGWDIASNGQPTSWSEEKSITSGAWYIQGADVALADLDGNGMQEMILMYVDNPGGANTFRYRVAWNMDSNGDPSYGWGAQQESPAMANNNAGAGAAVGDIDGDGSQDYLFAAIDADSADKDFNYYIGWDVDAASGVASSWSSLKTAPGIVDNPAGAGAELADLDGNGVLDLILMALDEVDGANRMYFRVGWNLDASGVPESWSDMTKGPYFSALTSGGGIAARDIDHDGVLDMALASLEDKGEDPGRFLVRVQNSFAASLGNAPINLAKYPEDAILTGFTVEENHGSTVGVFSSSEAEQVLLANTQLGYEFLRGQASLTDVPARLSALGITVSSDVQSFSHQDEAMAALTGSMTPEALDALPTGKRLPVVTALEDRAASVEMGQVQDQVRYRGNTFTVNMEDAPVATSKRIVTPWCNTDTQEELGSDSVSFQAGTCANSLGLTGEDKSNFLDLVMAWNAGESAMSRMGELMDPEPPETNKIMKNLVLGGRGFASVGRIAVGVRASYKAAKVLRAGTTSTAGLKSFKLQFGSVSQAKVGGVGKLDRVIKGAGAMGWVITAGVAFYAFFQIASAQGWSRLGVFSGAMYATLMTAYAIGLWAISCIPIVGGIISGLIAISDLLMGWISGSGWSEQAMKAIVEFFVDTYELSCLDLTYLDHSEVNVIDYDGNGLDVGDRIEISSRFQEYVYRCGPGTTQYLSSYIQPRYAIAPGYEDFGGHDETIDFSETNTTNAYILQNWTIRAWIELPNEMPRNNFPFSFYLVTKYKAYYEECSSGCDVKSAKGEETSTASVLYFDVLPKNLEQFLGWSAVLTPLDEDGDGYRGLDTDGDGVTDVELDSQGNVVNSSPRMWDSDLDGLSDPYEHEVTHSSTNYRDWDDDGIPDGVEAVIGTNPNNNPGWGTDSDWLMDVYEHRGWDISIPIGGQKVPMHVFSDPTKEDTDGDGLPDNWEALYRTNPRSGDTDGDGIGDFDEQDVNRPICPPIVCFNMNPYTPAVIPPRFVSSLKIPPGGAADLFAWRYFNPLVRPLGTKPGWIEGIKISSSLGTVSETLSWDADGFNLMTYPIDLPGSGIYYLRYFSYWEGEPMPADADMPIVAVLNSWGHDIWGSTGPDLDNDGVLDYNEYIGWPVTYHDNWGDQSYMATCNPTMKDTDLDGLTDGEEYAAGTDPQDKDTDHDCLTDKQEVDLGSNPLNSNTDSDPYHDAEEFIAGMNLLSNDSDGDGEIDNVVLGAGIDPLANLPMELHNDAAKTPPNQAVTVDVLANDIYYGAGFPTITGVSTPAHGQAQTDGEKITYTPAGGYEGQDSFTYTASHGGQSASAAVTITVAEINQPPKAYANACSVAWNGSAHIVNSWYSSVLANDVDPEGAPLTATLTVQPQHGTVSLNSDGTFIYQHDGTPTSQDVFNYKASDGVNDSNEASVLVTIDLSGDADSDGLLDWEEAEAGTLLDNPDTDGDGLLDGEDPYPLIMMADFNGDGSWTLADLVMGLKILTGLAPTGAQAPYDGPGNDVDGDAMIGAGDIGFLLQKLAGIRD